MAPVPDVTGHGRSRTAVAHGGGVVLKGKTNATFDGGKFTTADLTTEQGTGCKSCKGPNCVHVTGRVVSTYHVTTSVSLPSMAQFNNLTPCQRQRVKEAIENQLAPHEQQHVAAFEEYNGTTDQPFDLTTCRSGVAPFVQNLFNKDEASRRATAKADSAALDPFQINVDLDCTDD